ncbi:MAG: hypothetical protein L6R30_09210 [Thermoanaerobaculia bacterium]|nr:hypothetical protein [Thermoanaerobaculia bacterium]
MLPPNVDEDGLTLIHRKAHQFQGFAIGGEGAFMLFQRVRLAVVVLFASTVLAAGRVSAAEEAGPSASATFGKIPLHFEPNLGQGPAGTEFLARGENYLALVTSEGVMLQLRSGSCGGSERKGPMNREAERSLSGANPLSHPGSGTTWA